MNTIIYDKSNANHLEPVHRFKSKALCEIFGRNCIEYIFDIISKSNITKAYICIEDNGECEEFYKDKSRSVELEWNPKAFTEFKSDSEIVLFHGIKFYDANLSNALEYHKNSNADLTVVTTDIPNNPSGIYILSQRCSEYLGNLHKIPDNSEFVKQIESAGMKTVFCNDSAYVNPLFDISDYLHCHMDILNGKARFSSYFHRSISQTDNSCSIGKNVTIAKSAKLSECAIGNNVFIGENAIINSCVIHDGVHIGANVRCDSSIICKGASLLDGSCICKGSAIGTNAIIGRGAKVEENIRVFPKKHLSDYQTASFDVRYREFSLEFDDDGDIGGETGVEISPSSALRIGKSLSENGANFIIGHNGTHSAQSIAMALSSGILSGGASVWSLGECLISEMFFASKTVKADYCVFVQSDSYTKISVFSKNLTKLTLERQKEIEKSIRYDCSAKASAESFGKWHNFAKFKELYTENLSAKKPGFPITLSTSSRRGVQLINELKCDSLGSKITFRISGDGTKASAFSAQTGFISYEKLSMICIESFLETGKTPSLPEDFPTSAQQIFKNKGGFNDNNHNKKCESVFFDGFELIFCVCEYLSRHRITLEQAIGELPEFAIAQRIVSLQIPLPSTFSLLDEFCRNHPDVSVKPSKSGKTLLIRAESTQYETASELCDICQRIAQGHGINHNNSEI